MLNGFFKNREGWIVVFLDDDGDQEMTERPKVAGGWVKVEEGGETGPNGGS